MSSWDQNEGQVWYDPLLPSTNALLGGNVNVLAGVTAGVIPSEMHLFVKELKSLLALVTPCVPRPIHQTPFTKFYHVIKLTWFFSPYVPTLSSSGSVKVNLSARRENVGGVGGRSAIREAAACTIRMFSCLGWYPCFYSTHMTSLWIVIHTNNVLHDSSTVQIGGHIL